jgi:hypothetical protein
LSSAALKTTKSSTKKRKPRTKKSSDEGRIKAASELTALETLEAQIEGKVIREKKPLGKVFYLVFSIVFYAVAFFYINSSVYAGGDWFETAIFAFAALFVAFVLMLFNVHMLVFNFFVLPFKRLFKQAKMEANKEIFFTVGKTKIQTTFNKYRSIFTLVLYVIFAGLIGYATVMGSLNRGDEIIDIIYSTVLSLLIYVVVINSWQFLFYIIPSILDKSIDAKNGYVLALSAAVMVLYIGFMIFDIIHLAEIMIFVLIIGFIALLGVNLNMIVGEINIFQNLRNRASKAVTRVVFTIFFSFHIYVIIYASVVAFSIYNWQPDAFHFSENYYEVTVDDELYYNSTEITEVYTSTGQLIDAVYNEMGQEITEYVDDQGNAVSTIFDANGNPITAFYTQTGEEMDAIVDGAGRTITSYFYNDGRLATITSKTKELHTYGDFLYWTVITISTIGYGDISPSTEYPIAQAWGGFLGMYGLTFFALSISFVSNIAMEGVNIRREEHNDND